jgi:GNAT superfamily N-acetyltransferase
VPIILQLIRELAEYEHASAAVQATPESLLGSLAFGTEATSAARPARALLLFDAAGAPAGLALYFYNYSTWRAAPGIYLEDLFVRVPQRRKGYGARLLRELAAEVRAMRGGRLEWSVLKWNEPSIRFYKRIGARMMDEWVTMRVDGEALVELAGGVKGGDEKN